MRTVPAAPPRRTASLSYLFALLHRHRPRLQDAVKLRAARSFLEQRPSVPPPGFATPGWLASFLSLTDVTASRFYSQTS